MELHKESEEDEYIYKRKNKSIDRRYDNLLNHNIHVRPIWKRLYELNLADIPPNFRLNLICSFYNWDSKQNLDKEFMLFHLN